MNANSSFFQSNSTPLVQMTLLDPTIILAITVLSKHYKFGLDVALRYLASQLAPTHKLNPAAPPSTPSPAPTPMSQAAPAPQLNHGEKGEHNLKKRLVNGEKIHASLFNPTTKERIPTFLTINGSALDCKKASSKSKADIVEGVRTDDGRIWKPSIKTAGGKKPSLLNHTGRHLPAFHYERFKDSLKAFDDAVQKYWSRGLPHDVYSKRNDSPWHWPSPDPDERTPELVMAHRKQFLPILRYFLVEGTGTGPSKDPADCLIVYDPHAIRCEIVDLSTTEHQDNYLLSVFHQLDFSIRKKNYYKNVKARTDPRSHPWADPTKDVANMEVDEVRGALHVRLALRVPLG